MGYFEIGDWISYFSSRLRFFTHGAYDPQLSGRRFASLQRGASNFDPSYGYDLDGLLAIEPPAEPPGFAAFWSERYDKALAVDPKPELRPSEYGRPGLRVRDLAYGSTDGFPIRGWVLEPSQGPGRRGFVVGHGYGGIERPDFELPCTDARYLVRCFRGLCRSGRRPISDNRLWHVLHDIHLHDRYILGGSGEDLWPREIEWSIDSAQNRGSEST